LNINKKLSEIMTQKPICSQAVWMHQPF